ncbi:MAG: hypothetical protein VX519_08685, partial [Myxococcota bacterium]|nr:hypothetical protein [Myxococcota bacterium]
DWLEHIGSWSANHPTHAPITLFLDIKDDLTDNRHTSEGSLAALNLLLDNTLGGRLFTPEDLGAQWPTIDAMRGKILAVLSGAGEVNSRLAYIRDQGSAPAVAMNDSGQIIEVHKSESTDTLWYWTGQQQADGTVLWQHHGRFDNGREPAIALNNAGWFVEVHTSENQEDLWFWTGYVDTSGDLVFVGHEKFDSGRYPSIRFSDRDDNSLLEIHQSDSNANQNWDWELVLNTSTGELTWGDHGTTNSARHDTDSTTSGAGSISVHTGEDSAGADILTYETSAGVPRRIRYLQRAFVDTFPGESEILEEASSFRGYEHGDSSRASTWRGRGGLARIFEFQASDIDPSEMPPQFPSTDEPFEQWYTTWWETFSSTTP